MMNYLQVLLAAVLLGGAAHCRVILDDNISDVGEDALSAGGRVSLWATRAHDWLLGTACAEPLPTAPDLCRDLVVVPRGQIRVYAAASGAEVAEPVVATLVGPEGPQDAAKAQGPYDAVLVLDPYPAASFGHLVLVFFIALGTTEERCGQVHGLRLGNGDCVQPAREPRCSSGAGVAGAPGAPCALLFLPLVTPASRPPHQHHDMLQCRSDIAGFSSSSCPQLRPLPQVSHLRCDPVTPNSKRCDTTQFIRTRCPFMQTCDHAVLLSGGWNRHLSGVSSLRNILDVHSMLKHIGFHEDNIKAFFANGVSPDRDQGVAEPAMYPSALKLALRYHVHRLCETARCADTLLLYLNGPALPGGATLLWDVDGNGLMDETEVYSARELLRDVSHCGARRVILVADQSYATDLVRHATQLHASSRGLRNVVVLTAPARPADPNWTSHWTDRRHRHVCIADLAPDKGSVFVGNPSLLNTTLTGMPCGLAASLGQVVVEQGEGEVLPDQIHLNQLRQRQAQRYSGCQNLSTREWMAAQDPQDSQDQDEDDDDDEQTKRNRSENNA